MTCDNGSRGWGSLFAKEGSGPFPELEKGREWVLP